MMGSSPAPEYDLDLTGLNEVRVGTWGGSVPGIERMTSCESGPVWGEWLRPGTSHDLTMLTPTSPAWEHHSAHRRERGNNGST